MCAMLTTMKIAVNRPCRESGRAGCIIKRQIRVWRPLQVNVHALPQVGSDCLFNTLTHVGAVQGCMQLIRFEYACMLQSLGDNVVDPPERSTVGKTLHAVDLVARRCETFKAYGFAGTCMRALVSHSPCLAGSSGDNAGQQQHWCRRPQQLVPSHSECG